MNKRCDDAIHCGCSDIVEDLGAENRQLKGLLKTIRVELERPTSSNGRNQWKDMIDNALGVEYGGQ